MKVMGNIKSDTVRIIYPYVIFGGELYRADLNKFIKLAICDKKNEQATHKIINIDKIIFILYIYFINCLLLLKIRRCNFLDIIRRCSI